MIDLEHNLHQVMERIHQAEQTCQRQGQVRLLAVSKTKPDTLIRQAHKLGLRHFGENYLQEALDKITRLSDLESLCWHFIGPIQSNKTRDIAAHFHWVHSVDRLKIAQRLSEQRPRTLPEQNICLQVNISGEASKSGVALAELPELAQAVSRLPGLRLRGLMAIPAPQADPLRQRQPFRQLATALAQLNQTLSLQLDTLSMGMTADLEAAVYEGATLVRVGTALFGSRNPF